MSFRNALSVFNAETVPFLRADALDALGDVLFALASLRNDADIAGLAVDAYRKAEAFLEAGDLTAVLARVPGSIKAAQALCSG